MRGRSALGPEDRRNQVPAGSKTRHGESLDDDFSVDEAPIPGFREDSEKSRDAHSHAFRLASRFPVVDETQGRKLGSKADRLSLTPTECEAVHHSIRDFEPRASSDGPQSRP